MIRYAKRDDYEMLRKLDTHIDQDELKKCIDENRVLVMDIQGELAGWLRYSFFWDKIPFMNMLYFLEGNRGKGYGRQMVEYWEKEMEQAGYSMVLTSTLSNEQAQFFYRKMGYKDCGALLLPGEALEIILMKKVGEFG